MAHIRPYALQCEYLTNPLAVDVPRPRLSFKVASDAHPVQIERYQILVAATPTDLDSGPKIWASDILFEHVLETVYDGRRLKPTEAAHWRVQVLADGQWSEWSDVATWEAGIWDHNRWQAKWISHPDCGDWSERQPAPIFRKRFEIPAGKISRARLHVSARGLIVPFVNGVAVSDIRLGPGWTDYNKRVPYDTFDVTNILQGGDNALAALVGDGWYCGQVCWFGRNHYGSVPSGLMRIFVEFEDREPLVVGTDDSWRAGRSGTLSNDIMQGETYDLAADPTGWHEVGFDDSSWPHARAVGLGQVPLVARQSQPVRVVERLEPGEIVSKGTGRFIVDFGQNHAGVIEIGVSGQSADELTIRHAEILDADGDIYTANLRSAKATDTLRVNGKPTFWSPSFTFHGYRYAEISGYREGFGPEEVRSRVLHNDMERAGWFECSNPDLNQLFENVRWGMKSNFLEVPTDCPQRDERLGWMGDIQVFAPTAAYLYDIRAFMTKWLQDVLDGTSDEGVFPNVAPQIRELMDGAPGWADAGVLVPMTLARVYGDVGALQACYPAMKNYVEWLLQENPDFIWRNRRSHDFGDWLNVKDETSGEFLGSAFLAHDLDEIAQAATILGLNHEANRWSGLFERAKRAFLKEYAREGLLSSDTQTAYALGIRFKLGESNEIAAWGRRLRELVESRDGTLSTGFLGVAHLLHALESTGSLDTAYRLLLNDRYPSWLYSIRHGATTIWERWDGWTEEGGFQDVGMNSFNHYAFGSVGEWMFGSIGGIRIEGFPCQLTLKPEPGGDLNWAKVRWESPFGTVVSSWELSEHSFEWNVSIPPGVTTRVEAPQSMRDWTWSLGERPIDLKTSVTLGSGDYRFRAQR